MRKLFRLLFKGCWRCQWETIEKTRLRSFTPGRPTTEDEWGTRYTLRCKTCGEIKFRDP